MNKLTMFLTVRKPTSAATKHAIETFLMELTSQTDITAIRSNDSLGQFIYYDLTTDLQACDVSHIAHKILNNYSNDYNCFRRYLIFRCYICNYTEE